MDWTQELDNKIRNNVTALIKLTHENEYVIKKSNNPLITQLWIALGNILGQINEINLKLTYIERALQDLEKGKLKTTSKKDLIEINKAMKSIMQGRKK